MMVEMEEMMESFWMLGFPSKMSPGTTKSPSPIVVEPLEKLEGDALATA